MIGQGKLGQLFKLQDKKAKIKYNGKEIICRPLQYLEEDYESYLVEVLEDSSDFPPGTLIEVEEDEVTSVKEVN